MPTLVSRDAQTEAAPGVAAAERFLTRLDVRAPRLRVQRGAALIEADPRDLWRIVARRDEVLAKLGELGVTRVALDLGVPASEGGDHVAFL